MLTYSRTPLFTAMKRGKLRASQKLVLCFLADRGSGYYNQRGLADALDLDRISIRWTLKKLEREGWITLRVVPRKGSYITIRTDRVLAHRIPTKTSPQKPHKINTNRSFQQNDNPAKLAHLLYSSAVTAVAVDVRRSPGVLTTDLHHAAAPKNCAAGKVAMAEKPSGGRPAKPAFVNAGLMLPHMADVWSRKMGGRKTGWTKKALHIVRNLWPRYEAHEIAALFEAHCGDTDPFVISAGHNLETFVKRIDGLQLRSKMWRKRAKEILAIWSGVEVGLTAAANIWYGAIPDTGPSSTVLDKPKAAPEPERYVPAPGEITEMLKTKRAELRAERSKERTE